MKFRLYGRILPVKKLFIISKFDCKTKVLGLKQLQQGFDCNHHYFGIIISVLPLTTIVALFLIGVKVMISQP
jgi:hypothetical protein